MRLILPILFLSTPALALDCAEGQRVFAHPMVLGGSACVPIAPERVALVHTEAIPAFLLGIETVTTNVYFDMFLATYPGTMADGWRDTVVDVGYLPEADLESVAAAAPDLIVSASWHPEANEKLAAIAPTVVLSYEGPDLHWTDAQRAIAALFDKEAELAEAEAALEARMADFRDRLGDRLPTFSTLQVGSTPTELYVETAINFAPLFMQELGFVMAPGVMSPEDAGLIDSVWWYKLSPERITDVEADYILFRPGYDEQAEAAFRDGPLWQSLAALREGRIIRPQDKEGHTWSRENLAFAHIMLDDLYRDVLGLSPPPTANPYALWQIAE